MDNNILKRLKGLMKHLVLSMLALLSLFPFYWMIATSIRLKSDLFKMPPKIIPWPITFENYATVLSSDISMLTAFGNSVKIVVLVTLGTLFTSSLAAYAFAKIDFPGRDKIFGLFIGTMLIPGTVCLIPMYILFSKIGWIDTHYPLMVPIILFNAYGTFMIKQFMMGIPDSYIEAAMIDGGNHFQIFRKVILPLCKPVLITLGLFTIIGNWNNFTGALIFLNSESKYTVPLVINSFRAIYTVDWGLLMAAAVFAVLPILIIYLGAQKYIVEGVTLSGLKG